ncbi:MAG: hypothetical protein R2741_08480 [Methanolobus sp.]
MDIKYDMESNVMQVDGIDFYPDNLESNFIGVCSSCNSDVNSLSYHSFDEGMIVAGKCTLCETVFAILYDDNWNWQGEIPISQFFNLKMSKELNTLEGIGEKKLAAVFTPAEIGALYAKARGEKYVRQYLYRARKKYMDFEDLFETRIDI